ncbi:YraN family protein [Rickettsiales endosymbiont of Peranema trichophorum]|uniref:YraN family protein n=1 Tax=Rickettsiales endosymbiont of Peranema trichophorum TaxID=2486577 RepID=UPI00102392C5|nr:YraN family protein [Rickettsiales endosymbiont of Peranema trichophorum]RZI47339.1 YraN family protein [Rickettsiales endosymbiont of Peranema trichophorum]
MSRLETYQYGKLGEEIASTYLENNGYSVLQNRYRSIYGEIDLIALELSKTDDLIPICIVFIEVKSTRLQTNECRISHKQFQRISNSALHFLTSYPQFRGLDARFDHLIVQNEEVIDHIKNAWEYTLF